MKNIIHTSLRRMVLFSTILALFVGGIAITSASTPLPKDFPTENSFPLDLSLVDGFYGEIIVDENGKIIDTDTRFPGEFEDLSMKEFEQKLKESGEDAFFVIDPRDPLYNMTPQEIDALTESEWKKIDEEFLKIYGDDLGEYSISLPIGECDFPGENENISVISVGEYDFLSEKKEILEDVKSIYAEIKKDIPASTQAVLEKDLQKLSTLSDEEDFFSLLDAMYDKASVQIENYFMTFGE